MNAGVSGVAGVKGHGQRGRVISMFTHFEKENCIMQQSVRNDTLRSSKWLPAGFAITLIVFAAIAFMAFRSIHEYLANSSRVTTSREFHDKLEDAISSLKDIQRGARGYVITGDPSFLDPFRSGSELMNRSLDSVRLLCAAEPEQMRRLEMIKALGAEVTVVAEKEIGFVKSGAPDSARAIVREGQGKKAMDRIDEIANAMKTEEARLQGERERAADADFVMSFTYLGVGGGLNILLLTVIVTVLNRQIRRRQAIADQLQRSEQRLQTVINSVHEGITFSNTEGRFEVFNQRMKELTGYSKEDANRSGDFSRLLYPDPAERQAALDGVKALIEVPGTHLSETTITTKSGDRRVIRVASRVLGGPERRMFLTTYDDITEQRRLEERGAEAAEKLRLIYEHALDGICLFEESEDPEQRRLVECNAKYAELAGRSREELLRVGTTKGLAEPLSPKHNKAIEQVTAFRGSFTWLRPDGKENIIEYTAMPIMIRGKKFTIGIDRDVTERKKADEERERLIGELQSALTDVKTLSGLVPICAHCKKIRDDQGYWTQLEAYIQEHTAAQFSHGLCPDCIKEYYRDLHTITPR